MPNIECSGRSSQVSKKTPKRRTWDIKDERERYCGKVLNLRREEDAQNRM